ncbi:PilW family protein [Massilia endophytica]|uniref:PilW family protein n=1 Tax=Massilia endophytica TaxID=2899220 RepID=UPI001E3589E4|nr:PilW family protein [Massilia endophytica]UGQ47791.1 PilW family protein [Massilia endophytica]
MKPLRTPPAGQGLSAAPYGGPAKGDAPDRQPPPPRLRQPARMGPARLLAPRREGGFGMTEILVALAVGLLVTLTASAMLVSAGGNFTQHAAHAQLNDNGRFALELVGQALRQGSFVNLETDAWPGGNGEAAVAGLDAASLGHSSAGIGNPLAGAVNGSDVLALRYAGSGEGGGDGSVLNCAGFAVPRGAAWSIFYVARSDDGEAELRCKYLSDSSWSSDAIVRGVDSFQVLYGLDTDTPPDGVPNRYLNARGIEALDADLVLEGATAAAREADLRRRTHWKRVASLRLALLLHGGAEARRDTEPVVYRLFGPAYAAAGDAGAVIDEARLPADLRQRTRRLFEASYAVRNAQR